MLWITSMVDDPQRLKTIQVDHTTPSVALTHTTYRDSGRVKAWRLTGEAAWPSTTWKRPSDPIEVVREGSTASSLYTVPTATTLYRAELFLTRGRLSTAVSYVLVLVPKQAPAPVDSETALRQECFVALQQLGLQVPAIHALFNAMPPKIAVECVQIGKIILQQVGGDYSAALRILGQIKSQRGATRKRRSLAQYLGYQVGIQGDEELREFLSRIIKSLEVRRRQ